MSPRLNQLRESGAVTQVPVVLGPRDSVQRLLYWTPELEQWSRNACETGKSSSVLSIAEQLNLVFADFVAGKPMSSGLAKCDPPKGEGIWRFKTPDLRLYGWADSAQCMIMAKAEYKRVLVKPGPPKDREMGRATVAVRASYSLSCAYGERHELFPVIS